MDHPYMGRRDTIHGSGLKKVRRGAQVVTLGDKCEKAQRGKCEERLSSHRGQEV